MRRQFIIPDALLQEFIEERLFHVYLYLVKRKIVVPDKKDATPSDRI
jgi:hypothetical protein